MSFSDSTTGTSPRESSPLLNLDLVEAEPRRGPSVESDPSGVLLSLTQQMSAISISNLPTDVKFEMLALIMSKIQALVKAPSSAERRAASDPPMIVTPPKSSEVLTKLIEVDLLATTSESEVGREPHRSETFGLDVGAEAQKSQLDEETGRSPESENKPVQINAKQSRVSSILQTTAAAAASPISVPFEKGSGAQARTDPASNPVYNAVGNDPPIMLLASTTMNAYVIVTTKPPLGTRGPYYAPDPPRLELRPSSSDKSVIGVPHLGNNYHWLSLDLNCARVRMGKLPCKQMMRPKVKLLDKVETRRKSQRWACVSHKSSNGHVV